MGGREGHVGLASFRNGGRVWRTMTALRVLRKGPRTGAVCLRAIPRRATARSAAGRYAASSPLVDDEICMTSRGASPFSPCGRRGRRRRRMRGCSRRRRSRTMRPHAPRRRIRPRRFAPGPSSGRLRAATFCRKGERAPAARRNGWKLVLVKYFGGGSRGSFRPSGRPMTRTFPSPAPQRRGLLGRRVRCGERLVASPEVRQNVGEIVEGPRQIGHASASAR